MNNPQIWLVRHGETAWSLSRQHTGRTDIPLTETGVRVVQDLRSRLESERFPIVWSSPSQRARVTAELAGYHEHVEVKDELAEWHYGEYEGLTTRQILELRPGWQLFRDGCPGGETASDVGARVDRLISELRRQGQPALLFSSAHLLRVLAARWVGLPASGGSYLTLDTASISILGYEHDLEEPVIRRWNMS